MKRYAAWVVGAGLMLVASATPAKAQVHVDVGVIVPHVGARVIVGGPRVVYVPSRHYEPRRASRYDRWDRRGRGWEKREREYYKDVRQARREYERDIRQAEREYREDLRDARRDRRR